MPSPFPSSPNARAPACGVQESWNQTRRHGDRASVREPHAEFVVRHHHGASQHRSLSPEIVIPRLTQISLLFHESLTDEVLPPESEEDAIVTGSNQNLGASGPLTDALAPPLVEEEEPVGADLSTVGDMARAYTTHGPRSGLHAPAPTPAPRPARTSRRSRPPPPRARHPLRVLRQEPLCSSAWQSSAASASEIRRGEPAASREALVQPLNAAALSGTLRSTGARASPAAEDLLHQEPRLPLARRDAGESGAGAGGSRGR